MSNEWKTIDSAPKDGSHIQLYRPEIQFVGFYGKGAEPHHYENWRVNAPGLPDIFPFPTHWKPLDGGPNDE